MTDLGVVEVWGQLGAPGVQRAPELDELGDQAGAQVGDQSLDAGAARSGSASW